MCHLRRRGPVQHVGHRGLVEQHGVALRGGLLGHARHGARDHLITSRLDEQQIMAQHLVLVEVSTAGG